LGTGEKIGIWHTVDSNKKYHTVDVFKNPGSIKKLGPWTRGITDLDGNLYMAEYCGMIHFNLYEFLISKGELKGEFYEDYYERGSYKNSIAWQRDAMTSKLYLRVNKSSFLKNNYILERILEWGKQLENTSGYKFVWEPLPVNFNYKLDFGEED